jgi:hypothetical protein
VLTAPIGRAYNPATERGTALALGQGMFSCLVKLLIEMSESTAGINRLSFAVERGLPKPPQVGSWGFRTPGCLTSEDEERETWTAESLRDLEYLKTSVFIFRGRTKDFGGTRFE